MHEIRSLPDTVVGFRFKRHSKSSDISSKGSDDEFKSYQKDKYKYDSSDDESD